MMFRMGPGGFGHGPMGHGPRGFGGGPRHMDPPPFGPRPPFPPMFFGMRRRYRPYSGCGCLPGCGCFGCLPAVIGAFALIAIAVVMFGY